MKLGNDELLHAKMMMKMDHNHHKRRIHVLKTAAMISRLHSPRKRRQVQQQHQQHQQKHKQQHKQQQVTTTKKYPYKLQNQDNVTLARAREWLCDRPHDILRLTGNLYREEGRSDELLIDRDGIVRLFYHSVLPNLLIKRQPSHLLLHLCRRRSGTNGGVVVIAESWHQESQQQLFHAQPIRPQDNVSLDLALQRLRQVITSGCPYALRVVVEAAPGGAHALLVLIRGSTAWLVDPNGDFSLVHVYFGSRETLTRRLEELLGSVGCVLIVPQLPPLHKPTDTNYFQEYCRGGACTFVTGAVALRALEKNNPELVLKNLAFGSPYPITIASEVDQLIALTVACHIVGGGCARQNLLSRVLQLVGK